MNKDEYLSISLLGGRAQAFLTDGTQLVETARRTHSLSKTATAALGRTLIATSIMGYMLKGDNESVTVNIKGGGPIGSILAVAKSDGRVKGYVDDPNVELPRNGKKLPVGAAVGRNGKLTVVKDLNMREPYVGQVNLVSGEIAEDFAMYFTASEQTPAVVSLGVLVSDRVEAAGGLIVRLMPGADEEAIAAIESRAPMFADISGIIKELGAENAADKLFSGLDAETLFTAKPIYACDCSRKRIERMLITLGADELTDMINSQHGAEVDCHFCNKRYRFNEAELKAIYAQATGGNDEV